MKMHFFKKIGIYIILLFIPLILFYIEFDGKDILLTSFLHEFISHETDKVIEILGGIIYITIFFIILIIIRKVNDEKSFSDGSAGVYVNYPYFVFWFASKVLGYKKVNLVLIPVPIQYKLILRNTFEVCNVDGDIKEVCEEEILVLEENMSNKSDSINILLSDTYDVTKDKIPKLFYDIPSITIKRMSNGNRVRVNSVRFIDRIEEVVAKCKNEYTTVNLFAYTNTLHNKKIASKCFRIAGRSKLTTLVIFNCNNLDHIFCEKGYTIKI